MKTNHFILRALVIGCLLTLVTSFGPFALLSRQHHRPSTTGPGQPPSTRSTYSTPFNRVEDTDVPIEEDPVKNQKDEQSKQRHHWLDLRGTAIRPEEALAFLDEFLVDEEKQKVKSDNDQTMKKGTKTIKIRDMIDCIIVPKETFRDNIPEKIASRVSLWVVDDDSTLVQDQSGEPRGTFVGQNKDNSLWINPLDSLEMYNRGDWILFESSASNDQEDLVAWVEQIGSLLQLLPATAAPSSMETPSGLILPSSSSSSRSSQNENEPSSGLKRGGVGICCSSREAIFRVDALLEQVLSSAGSVESANSGILLLANKDNSGSGGGSSLPIITSALILPFDLNLWRAVLELRRDTSDR